ncbi:hypothetical protein SAMN05877838_1716 [Hoeflea halophila]|uniref:Uncharacterized protein n=1 Tax=Hoeflea halophila TaxID=714899 RepID=A0A286IC05_9HYPH|nr:hypothetical protein SAMN05877838_1716 [Hoeflea halophila]
MQPLLPPKPLLHRPKKPLRSKLAAQAHLHGCAACALMRAASCRPFRVDAGPFTLHSSLTGMA